MGCWAKGRLHEQFGDTTKEQYSPDFWLGARKAMCQEIQGLNSLPVEVSNLHNGPIEVDVENFTVGRDMVVNEMGDFLTWIDNYAFMEPANNVVGMIQTFHFIAAGRPERDAVDGEGNPTVVRLPEPI